MKFEYSKRNVSTPVFYNPRNQPPSPLPSPLPTDSSGFIPDDNWTCVESSIAAKGRGAQDIKTKLYIPASKTFSVAESIPFHLLLCSTPASLATFLPLSPSRNTLGRPKALRLQVMRQVTVDVRYVHSLFVQCHNECSLFARNVITSSRVAGREMWRVDCVGEANFNLTVRFASFPLRSTTLIMFVKKRRMRHPGSLTVATFHSVRASKPPLSGPRD